MVTLVSYTIKVRYASVFIQETDINGFSCHCNRYVDRRFTFKYVLAVLIGDVIGIFGGYVVGVYQLGFNPANYIKSTIDNLEALDITTGVVKAAVFGFIIAVMGCYNGFKSKGGAQGVGEATTNAVVSSSILILIFNYIITGMFFSK